MSTKAPQDHKKKTTAKPAAEQPTGVAAEPDHVDVVVDGRTWSILADALDDWELLDDLGEADAGNASRLPRILRKMLGAGQYQTALTLLRDDNGRITLTAGTDFVNALFMEVKAGNLLGSED